MNGAGQDRMQWQGTSGNQGCFAIDWSMREYMLDRLFASGRLVCHNASELELIGDLSVYHSNISGYLAHRDL